MVQMKRQFLSQLSVRDGTNVAPVFKSAKCDRWYKCSASFLSQLSVTDGTNVAPVFKSAKCDRWCKCSASL